MKRTIVCLVCFSAFIYSDTGDLESSMNDDPFRDQNFLFVSLGSICRTADILRECGLRICAFPFDWIISTDGEKLIEILDRDFDSFITEETPFIDDSISLDRGGLTLLHPQYHLEFSHESTKSEDGSYFVDWMAFRSKFHRRINRFRNIEHFKGKVFFVRSAWVDCRVDRYLTYRNFENIQISEEYAVKLFDALRRKFPNLDFSLIIKNTCLERGIYAKKINENLWITWSNPEPLSEALPETKQFYQEVLQCWNLAPSSENGSEKIITWVDEFEMPQNFPNQELTRLP